MPTAVRSPNGDEVDKELWGWFQDFLFEVKKIRQAAKTNSQQSLSRAEESSTPPTFDPRHRRQSSRRQSVVNVFSSPTTPTAATTPSVATTEVSGKPTPTDVSDLFPSPPLNARRETLPGYDALAGNAAATTSTSNTSSHSVVSALPSRRTLGIGLASSTTTLSSQQGVLHNTHSSITNESLLSNPTQFSSLSKRGSSGTAWSGTTFGNLAFDEFMPEENRSRSQLTHSSTPRRASPKYSSANIRSGSSSAMEPILSTHQGGGIQTRSEINTAVVVGPAAAPPPRKSSISISNPSLVWKGIESANDPEADVSYPEGLIMMQHRGSSRHNSGPANSGESSESATSRRVNSQSFSSRIAVHRQSRLSSAIKGMDRFDLDNHMEKAVRLLFQLIKERKSHRVTTEEGASGENSLTKKNSFHSNILAGSIFQSAGSPVVVLESSQKIEKRRFSHDHHHHHHPRKQSIDSTIFSQQDGRKRSSLEGGRQRRTNSVFESCSSSNVGTSEDTSSSFSDGYDHEPSNNKQELRKPSKRLIREKRRHDENPEVLAQYHAFQDAKRSSYNHHSLGGTGAAAGGEGPLDITGAAWEYTIKTNGMKNSNNDNNTDNHGKYHQHGGHQEDHNHHVSAHQFPNMIVITDSMDIDDLMGSKSLMDMSDFVRHTEIEKERDQEGNRILNGYVFQGSLGRGAYGKVRLAYERENPEKKVAIKIINKSLSKAIGAPSSRSSPTTFHKEIAIMKKLRHKNIVTLHAVIDDPEAEKLYLIMDHIGGGHILQEETDPLQTANGVVYKALPEPTVVKYLRQLIDGIRYLHKHQIAHRDIKPTNLLLGEDNNRLFIADFGVSELGEVANVNELNISYTAAVEESKLLDTTPPQSPMLTLLKSNAGARNNSSFLDTTDGSGNNRNASLSPPPHPPASEQGTTMVVRGQKGTPMFWPPEMFKASEMDYFVDGESQDLWALGVTTYMMLTGKAPFASTNFYQLKNEIISDAEVEIPDFLSEHAQHLLRSLLHKDPSKRPTLIDVRNHEFMGGYDKRTAAARGSFSVAPADAEEEASAISVAKNAIPMMKFFLFRAKPFFRRFIARIREKIKLKHQNENTTSNEGFERRPSTDVLKSSHSINSALSNTLIGGKSVGPTELFSDTEDEDGGSNRLENTAVSQGSVEAAKSDNTCSPLLPTREHTQLFVASPQQSPPLTAAVAGNTCNRTTAADATLPPSVSLREPPTHIHYHHPAPPTPPLPNTEFGTSSLIDSQNTAAPRTPSHRSVNNPSSIDDPHIPEVDGLLLPPSTSSSSPAPPPPPPHPTQSHHLGMVSAVITTTTTPRHPPPPTVPSSTSAATHPTAGVKGVAPLNIHHHLVRNEEDAKTEQNPKTTASVAGVPRSSIYTVKNGGPRPATGVYSVVPPLRRKGSALLVGAGNKKVAQQQRGSSESSSSPNQQASGPPPLRFPSTLTMSSSDSKEASSPFSSKSWQPIRNGTAPLRSVSLPVIPTNNSALSPRSTVREEEEGTTTTSSAIRNSPRRKTDDHQNYYSGTTPSPTSRARAKLMDAISDGSSPTEQQ